MTEYTLVKDTDILCCDYVFYPKKSIAELKEICDGIQDAIGFNSLGYIKKQNGSYRNIKNIDLYINQTRVDSILKLKKNIASNNIKQNITFVTTTCKRLSLFEKTMDSFLNQCQDLYVIDKWLCIDDNSSQKDRDIMQEKYPFFEFVFKNESQKGHPQSLNIMLEKVNTKYVFLLEDDWETSAPLSITDYVNFLQDQDYDQIIFREFFEPSHPKITVINNIPVRKYLYFHKESVESVESGESGKTGLEKNLKNKYIEYEKEFDIYNKFPNDNGGHYYPGFSLNPSIFCIEKIKNNNLTFSEDTKHHDSFEVYFSFQCKCIANMKISFSKVHIEHIGYNNSAYVLNDEIRELDRFIGDINLVKSSY